MQIPDDALSLTIQFSSRHLHSKFILSTEIVCLRRRKIKDMKIPEYHSKGLKITGKIVTFISFTDNKLH